MLCQDVMLACRGSEQAGWESNVTGKPMQSSLDHVHTCPLGKRDPQSALPANCRRQGCSWKHQSGLPSEHTSSLRKCCRPSNWCRSCVHPPPSP